MNIKIKLGRVRGRIAEGMKEEKEDNKKKPLY